MARSKRFDAIVSDIAMPDMDGLALLRDIRQTRSRRADDLHDRQPGAGDARWRRSSTARSATCSSRCRWRRCWGSSTAPCAVHKLARVRREASLVTELEGQADRRSRRAGGAVRVGGREAVGRRAADRVLVGAQASSRTRRCCAPTNRRCAARWTSSTRPSAWGAPPSWGASSARHVAVHAGGRAAAGPRVRQPAPGRSRGSRALRRRRRADAVRGPGRPGDHRARGARPHSRAAACA